MEYIKTYIYYTKAIHTKVIYFCYMYSIPNFYFDRLPSKFLCVCIQYDMMLVFSNETVNSHEVNLTACEFMWSCRHVVRCRG